MEIVDYYYKILDLDFNATIEEIYQAYSEKIKKYRNLPFFNSAQKNEVKELKKAKFVLTNEELRKILDSSINKKYNEESKMKEWEKTNSNKKEKVNSQLVGDRIFSMAGILNIPQKNLDMDRTFFAGQGSRDDNLAEF
jgi:DnaJ-class molecular chaperone